MVIRHLQQLPFPTEPATPNNSHSNPTENGVSKNQLPTHGWRFLRQQEKETRQLRYPSIQTHKAKPDKANWFFEPTTRIFWKLQFIRRAKRRQNPTWPSPQIHPRQSQPPEEIFLLQSTPIRDYGIIRYRGVRPIGWPKRREQPHESSLPHRKTCKPMHKAQQLNSMFREHPIWNRALP